MFLRKLFKNVNKKTIITFVVLIATIGASYMLISSASTPTAQCGARVQNYSYDVPHGNAVWNQPVCDLPRHDRSEEFAYRLFNWSRLSTDGSKKLTNYFDFGPNFVDVNDRGELYSSFGRNVYYAKDATTTTRVWSYLYGHNLDSPQKKQHESTATIPWNPAWITGQAGDNEMVILDDSNGKIYELANYIIDPTIAATRCNKFDLSQGGFVSIANYSNMICTGSASIGRDLDGNIIDYRTFEGAYGDRGLGLSKFIGFTMPEEILAGEIRHALDVTIPNTDKGPECTKTQLGTQAENVTCGTAVAPATKFEFGSRPHNTTDSPPWNSVYDNSKSIPEGLRYALDIDDAYIENWIQSRQDLRTNARKAETARIVARALRDYGFIIGDTGGAGGGGVGVRVAGTENPDSRQKWNQLGLYTDDDSKTLMNGLIEEDRLYVVDPPTLTCKDGSTTKYYCKWTTATYSSTGGKPNPTGKISDFDGDNIVGLSDLAILLSKYNSNVPAYKDGDSDGNGYVNLNDLAILLSNYGK